MTNRWKKLDPNLRYFECAFDLMEEEPEAYDELRMDPTGPKLTCYPGEKQLAERNAYFEARRQEYAEAGIECTDERLLQDELCRALKLAFQEDFPEYMQDVE